MIKFIRRKILEYYFVNDIFSVLLQKANKKLQKEILYSKNIKQREDKHPEGSVFIHTKIVTNQVHRVYNNLDLTLAGLFHDLGKNYTTEFNYKKGFYTAYEHEKKSVDIIEEHRQWIKHLGGNVELINYVVKNHMRIKNISEMRSGKRKRFENEKHFKYVQMFATCD